MSDLARTKQPGPTLNQRFFTLRRFCFLVAAIIIALLPLIFPSSYWRTNLIVCAINVLLAIGLDFVLGYTGQLNIGQSAFYGIGALCLDVANHQARRAVLGCLCARRADLRNGRRPTFAVRGPPARALSGHCFTRFRGDYLSNPFELD